MPQLRRADRAAPGDRAERRIEIFDHDKVSQRATMRGRTHSCSTSSARLTGACEGMQLGPRARYHEEMAPEAYRRALRWTCSAWSRGIAIVENKWDREAQPRCCDGVGLAKRHRPPRAGLRRRACRRIIPPDVASEPAQGTTTTRTIQNQTIRKSTVFDRVDRRRAVGAAAWILSLQ